MKKNFSINDTEDYKGITEIFNMIKGTNFKTLNRSFKYLNKNYYLWVFNQGGKDDWIDLLSFDEEKIKEIDLTNKEGKPDFPEKFLRVVFVKEINKNPRAKFVGVFKSIRAEFKDGHYIRHYKRISLKIELDKLK
nr:hypothetical protein [uncultured Treponema sp.]